MIPSKQYPDKAKIKKIEDFLEKSKISGIIRIPGIGTFSTFRTFEDKLCILDHARVELLAQDLITQDEARERIENSSSNTRKKTIKRPLYIG